MKQYHDLVKHILDEGTQKGDRTGTGTLSVFGSEKYVLISERNLKTSFNADLMKDLNLSKVRGLAVVSEEGVSRREELIKEQSLFKGSFAYFTNYKAAEEWARTFD